MNNIYQGKSGNIYEVIEPSLASGGEGSIYSISGYDELVLKIFKADRRTKDREEKLLKMVGYRLSQQQLKQITWPQDVVYDQNGFAGYVMPRLRENKNLNIVYSSDSNTLDLRHRMLIAYNLCAAVDTVHSLNQVCGDLNPQNICVNFNMDSETALQVTLVDTDSYHITDGKKTYRCEVGLANYIAPEIQKKLTNGRDLRSVYLPTYTKETDLFALAVHIFALLMNGCHPFACAKQTNTGYEHTMNAMDASNKESVVLPQPIENIRDGFFPFHQKREGITYPLYAPDFQSIPVSIQKLFIRAFENGYTNPKERPTSDEWMAELRKYQSSVGFYCCAKGHYYLKTESTECLYCAASQRMLRMIQGGFEIPPKPQEKPPVKDIDSSKNTPIKEESQSTNTSSLFRHILKVGAIIGLVMLFLAVCIDYSDINNHTNEVAVDEMNFPDQAFREIVLEDMDLDDNGYLNTDEINAIMYLDFTGKNISDLTGIEQFENLESLYFSGNNLNKIDLSGNKKLSYLSCEESILEMIDVSGCTNLQILFCDSSNLSTLDVSGCTNLQELYCDNNSLSSLDVSGCTNLQKLWCDNNSLSNLDVSDCTNLQMLSCDNNSLSSLDVSDCTNLQELCCDNNSLSNLDVSDCTNLQELSCDNNSLSSLDVSDCTNLQKLSCDNNSLSSLDVSGCTNLQKLWCDNNSLSSLDVSDCTNLQTLSCDNNSLSSLDVSDCTNLQRLWCRYNSLSSLDVSNCKKLQYLFYDEDKVTIINP